MMYKFTAADARNITAVNIEKIKSESVESWLSCVFEMIEIAAQKTKEELVLSGYFWVHKSPERSKVFEILRENGMMWHFNWVQSRRGGHYIFEIYNVSYGLC